MRCLNDTCENGGLCNYPFLTCTCKPGWVGDNCQNECAAGLYGTDCIKKCNCYSGYFCNAQYGCVKNPWHNMPFYETTFFIISVVISAVLVSAIILTTMLILKKRRQSVLNLSSPETNNQVQELCVVQSCVSSQENTYEEPTVRAEYRNSNFYEEPTTAQTITKNYEGSQNSNEHEVTVPISPHTSNLEQQSKETSKGSHTELIDEKKVEKTGTEMYDVPKKTCCEPDSSKDDKNEATQYYDTPKNCNEIMSSKENLDEGRELAAEHYDFPKKNSSKDNLHENENILPETNETENIYENTKDCY